MSSRKSVWIISLLAFSALFAAGCISNSASQRDPENSTGDTAPNGAPQGAISASSMRDLLPQASEFQKRLLDDGQLTLAEYESAKLAQVRCLTDAGLRVDGDLTPNGLYVIRFSVVSEGPLRPTGSRISDCKKEYAHIIDMVWAEVSVPLVQEVIAESRRMMAACYAESGLRVEDKPHDSMDPDIQSRYRRCNDRVQTALNLGGVSYGVEGDGRPQ